ncbi:MAG: DUF58 domain-containing protein [Opitutales bacterium]
MPTLAEPPTVQAERPSPVVGAAEAAVETRGNGKNGGPLISAWAGPNFGPVRKTRKRQPSKLGRFLWRLIIPPEGHRLVFTRAGYVLAVVVLGLISASVSTSSNILVMALSLLLAVAAMGFFLGWLNFRRLRWRLHLPEFFREGEIAPVDLEVHNAKRLFPAYGLNARLQTQDKSQKHLLHQQERLDPGETLRLRWDFEPRRRGTDRIDVRALDSLVPFGFVRKTVGGRLRCEIKVWPKRVDYNVKLPGLRGNHQQGQTRRRLGNSTEIINIRQYRPGDAQRLVHWKASARNQTLMVRQMAEENRAGYVVFIETPASLWKAGPQFEQLCALAGTLAEDLFRADCLTATAVNREPLNGVKRLHDLHVFFDQLAQLEPVEHLEPIKDVSGPRLIQFRPGSGDQVHVHLGGREIGSA